VRIAALAGLRSASSVTPYLDRLVRLELVERRTLPTEAADPRPRISRYVLADPYLRFYFAMVDPWRSPILLGQGARVLADLWPVAFDRHVSWIFEEVAAGYVRRLGGTGGLPVMEAVGGQWLAAGDVDVVGVRGGRVLVARSYVKPGNVADLRRDASAIAGGTTPELLLFSRSGFDPALRSEPGPRLVTLADLFRADL
jgi:hypothetical protein